MVTFVPAICSRRVDPLEPHDGATLVQAKTFRLNPDSELLIHHEISALSSSIHTRLFVHRYGFFNFVDPVNLF